MVDLKCKMFEGQLGVLGDHGKWMLAMKDGILILRMTIRLLRAGSEWTDDSKTRCITNPEHAYSAGESSFNRGVHLPICMSGIHMYKEGSLHGM